MTPALGLAQEMEESMATEVDLQKWTPNRYPACDGALRSAYLAGVQAARFRNGASLTFEKHEQRKAFYDGLIDGGMFEAALKIRHGMSA